jgi:hypothetical protein
MAPVDIRTEKIAATSLEVNFSLALFGAIESIKKDRAQLRNAVYDLARVQLQREAWHQNPHMNILEIPRLMLALETAIGHVEAFSSQQDQLRALQSVARLVEGADTKSSASIQRNPVTVIDQTPITPSKVSALPASPIIAQFSAARKWIWPRTGPLLRGSALGCLLLVLYVIFNKQFSALQSKTPPAVQASRPAIEQHEAPKPIPTVQWQSANDQHRAPVLPLPVVYGVYAVSGGQLHELEALVGRVPEKVFMSTAIKTPSHTAFPDGRVQFIVFRRDIANSVPDRVAVRVIAKIKRGMGFDPAGKAITAAVEDTWTVRNVSYDFRVAPLSENPEMLLLRPENADFAFSPGRYGLILKGQAYDFTVAGEITEAAQCLERVAAANGTFYFQCKSP